MQPRQNPFSLYDFLGYLVPGMLFLVCALALGSFWLPQPQPFDYLQKSFGLLRGELYVPFVIVAYALGHVISFLSSLTVERYAIWRFDYPSKYLLDFDPPSYFDVEAPKTARKILRALVWLGLSPVSIPDYLLGDTLGMRDLYARKLDPLLVGLLWGKINGLVVEQSGIPDPAKYGKPREHDFFRFVYHYTLEHAPSHQQKMQNYVALYGFLRTLTFLCALTFWALLLTRGFGHLSAGWSLSLLAATAFVAFVFFLGFIKFYRRFTLEVLMALSAVFKQSPK